MNAQIKAIRIAIHAIELVRREKYATGHAAYLQGLRAIDYGNGVAFDWAESDYKNHNEYTQAIRQLQDLEEIITDPGVTVDEFGGLPLFEKERQT